MNDYEIYALCNNRNKDFVLEFLDKFLPNRIELADDYAYPQFTSEIQNIFKDYKELLDILEINHNETYALYWKSTDHDDISNVMVFFTEDKGMIVGIVVNNHVEKWFEKVVAFTKSSYAYASFNTEEPPPETQEEFIDICCTSGSFYTYKICDCRSK